MCGRKAEKLKGKEKSQSQGQVPDRQDRFAKAGQNLDPLGRTIDYLRISVTDRCNLRCIYCMPEGCSRCEQEPPLSLEELLEIAGTAADFGISHIKVTGGEPLLREDTGENANNSAFSAYGYLFDPDIPCMMKPDPATAPVVQKIFQMHLSGILTNQIATYLTKEGIPSPITRRKQMGTTFHYGSSHWSYVSILKILQNRTYIGEHIYRLPKLPRHMKKQAEEVAEQLAILEAENATLIQRRDKLEDPNYVETYARGEYMFSKDDEKIFYLPGNTASPESTDDSQE